MLMIRRKCPWKYSLPKRDISYLNSEKKFFWHNLFDLKFSCLRCLNTVFKTNQIIFYCKLKRKQYYFTSLKREETLMFESKTSERSITIPFFFFVHVSQYFSLNSAFKILNIEKFNIMICKDEWLRKREPLLRNSFLSYENTFSFQIGYTRQENSIGNR